MKNYNKPQRSTYREIILEMQTDFFSSRIRYDRHEFTDFEYGYIQALNKMEQLFKWNGKCSSLARIEIEYRVCMNVMDAENQGKATAIREFIYNCYNR